MFNWFDSRKKTLPVQVLENRNDIDKLKQYIAYTYGYNGELTTDTTSCPQGSTDVPNNTTYGFLIDNVGHVFKILGVTSSIVTIKYYATITGGGSGGTVVSINGVEKTSINTDLTPTANSENLITSGGVHDYPAITFAESERQKSKNLFNINKLSFDYTSGSWSINYNSGTITFVNSSANSTSELRLKDFTDLKAGKTYKLSYAYTGTPTNLFIYLNGSDSSWSNGDTHTITQAELDSGIHMYGSNTGTVTLSDIIMVEDGVDIDYQPYNGAIVHEKDIEPDLIYDLDTKNTIGGTAYTSGINYGTTINNDFTPYKKVKVYAYRQQNGPFTYEINLEQKNVGQNVYSGSGICYSYQEADNYFVYSSASISENKQQLRIIKCGYTTDFFTTPTLETTCYIYRLEGFK